MEKLRDLFEKDPYRDIVSVVKVDDHTPEIVWMELEEYIPTDEIKENFRRIIEGFITKSEYTEEGCVWLSGFFGSGKSHFLKVLGYLLENRELTTPDGRVIHSTAYLATKLGLQNFAPHLSKEFRTKVLFLNLLDYDHAVEPTLSKLIYKSLMKEKGFSDIIWVSLWEEELRKEGKYEEFVDWVRNEYGSEWKDKRKLHAEVILKKALPLFLALYSDEENIGKPIEDSKRVEITPSEVVTKIKEFAEDLDVTKGRVVVLLDEAGLYVGDHSERLTDLNALAEQVVKEGKGKVRLIATSQEKLSEIISTFAADRQKLEWLRDRFRHYSLTPKDVERVVTERMLKKNVEAMEQLRGFYQTKGGLISEALGLKSTRLPTSINEDGFITFYPFLPYSISLLQDISRALVRTVDDARRFSARERSMLKIVHAILRGEGTIDSYAEKDLGVFVTFDILYDAISSDLRFIGSDYHRIIEKEIGELGVIDGIKVSSVAKTLFLLQNIEEKVPCSLDNLAAVLFPHINFDRNKHREAVKQCLTKLMEKGLVNEEDGVFRLLTYDEIFLEGIIKENWPRGAEKREFLKELLEEDLHKFQYLHGKSRRAFEVGFTTDGEKIMEGELEVVFYTSFSDKNPDEILIESSEYPNIIYWISAHDSVFERILERTKALKKTEDQFRTLALTERQRQYIKVLSEEYVGNINDVKRSLDSVFGKGIIYRSGVKHAPRETIEKTLEEYLEPVASALYSEFVDARPKKDEECSEILKWKPGVRIGDIYSDLEIITNNTLNVMSAKVTSTVLKQIQYRRSYGLSRTGKDLLAEFEKPPYGWDPRLVRLVVASLFKAGKISIRWNDREFFSADPELDPVFAKVMQFQKASFDILPEVDWRKAGDLLWAIFGERSEATFEKTAEKVGEVAVNWLTEAKQSLTRVTDNELPKVLREKVEAFIIAVAEVTKVGEPNARLRVFLEKENDLRENFKMVRKVKSFDFQNYRAVRKFIDNPFVGIALADFGEMLDALRKQIHSEAVVDRLNDAVADYTSLLDAYTLQYKKRHETFNNWMTEALAGAETHKAVALKPEEANEKLEELRKLQCLNWAFDTTVLLCTSCRRHITELDEALVMSVKQKVLVELDKLVPEEKKEPHDFELREEVQSEDSESVIKKLREYFSKYRGTFEVKILIKPKK